MSGILNGGFDGAPLLLEKNRIASRSNLYPQVIENKDLHQNGALIKNRRPAFNAIGVKMSQNMSSDLQCASGFQFVRVATIMAQTSLGSRAGAISYPDGSFIAQAAIQLQNKGTGAVARTTSAANGRYSFIGLAPGIWEFSASVPCCAYGTFTKDINIEHGKLAELNARLVETINGDTLG